MKRVFAALLALLFVWTGMGALAEGYRIDERNADSFGSLIVMLLKAYETPSDGDAAAVKGALKAIRDVSEGDYEVAYAIAKHWYDVYIDKSYSLCLYHPGEERASELEAAGLEVGDAHALVVLGYELKDGEMTGELMGRCDAAAAAARSFPNAIVVCSGGATGENNPLGHTEAGLMRDYLTQKGIDPARIYIDEQAMTTVDNALNTLEMLKARDIHRMTIITSTYHQRWGQVIYNAVAALYRRESGYSVEIVGNYCFDIEPSRDVYRQDDRMAARQLTSVLNLPRDVVERMKEGF